MSDSPLADDKAKITKELGAMAKLFKAVKKFISKEFLWILLAIILGIPFAFVLTWLVNKYLSPSAITELTDDLNGYPLFIDAYVVAIGGIYLTRMVYGALKSLGSNK